VLRTLSHSHLAEAPDVRFPVFQADDLSAASNTARTSALKQAKMTCVMVRFSASTAETVSTAIRAASGIG
jgi:hypothetical protein